MVKLKIKTVFLESEKFKIFKKLIQLQFSCPPPSQSEKNDQIFLVIVNLFARQLSRGCFCLVFIYFPSLLMRSIVLCLGPPRVTDSMVHKSETSRDFNDKKHEKWKQSQTWLKWIVELVKVPVTLWSVRKIVKVSLEIFQPSCVGGSNVDSVGSRVVRWSAVSWWRLWNQQGCCHLRSKNFSKISLQKKKKKAGEVS